MPRGRRAAAANRESLDELLGEREAPSYLGNFPPETERIERERAERRQAAEATAAEDPELDDLDPNDPDGTDDDDEGLEALDAGGEGEAADDADASHTPGPAGSPGHQDSRGGLSPADERYLELQARVESQQRELEFLRASQQGGTSPAAPGQAAIDPATAFDVPLPFEISEQDMEAITTGGPRARELFQRALTMTARATAQHTARVVANAYIQNQGQVQQQQTEAQQASAFLAQNTDLQPYTDTLQAHANAVWQEMPYASTQQKLAIAGARARARLREMGIRVAAAAPGANGGATPTPRRPRRVLPATAEMGGGGSGNGRTSLSKRDKTMLELVPQGML